jgi:RHS repeat-associated protein
MRVRAPAGMTAANQSVQSMKNEFVQAMNKLRTLQIGLLGLAMSVQVAASTSIPAQTVTRNSSFKYFSNGLLQQKQIEPGAAADLSLTFDYTYDAFGNRATETQSGSAKQRTVTSNWDASGRFQTEAINPLLQKEQFIEYDDRFGLVTKRIDINGQMTVWKYDDFGRKEEERRGYANKDATTFLNYTTWTYQRCADVAGGCAAVQAVAPAYVVTAATLSSQGVQIASTVKVYYDVLNRELRTETQVVETTDANGVSTTITVYKDTQYDSRGNVYRMSQPYASGAAVKWTTADYDDLGRVTNETTPNNLQTHTDYNGLVTTRTVMLSTGNRVTTATANALGQQVEVHDALGNTTSYAYDALGKLSHTVNPYGDVVETVYNIRGHRTDLKDPDLGSWTYKPDAFGEVQSQTGPLAKTTSFTYDALGRVTQRADTDLTTNFEFDTADNGIGALAKVWTDNGYCRTQSYDTLGRSKGATLLLGGSGTTICTQAPQQFISGLAYDAVGRVDTQTFPTGLKVKNVYDATRGTLIAVKRYTGDVLGGFYWRRQKGDAVGRVTDFAQGNDVVTGRTYDTNSMGWLTGITATGNVLGDIQLSAYDYDATGQLSKREDKFDLANGMYEQFKVDALGRLKTMERYNAGGAAIPGSQIAVTYDAIGRIKTKSDTGTFYYERLDGKRPHAVTAVRGALTGDYTYDPAGQMITRSGQAFLYTDSGHLRMGGAGSTCHEFLMQGEGLRVVQTIYGAACNPPAGSLPANNGLPVLAKTTYMHPDASNGLSFEVEVKGGVTTYRHYINADGRAVALVTSSSTGLTSDQASSVKASYLHYDHLGSIVAVTGATGAATERRSYDSWGSPRALDGTAGTGELPNGLAGEATDRGYTLHEHLEGLGLIHMNGRVYDPRLARFTSPDPQVTVPTDLQSYDRYAYVMNRPLDSGDPTGYGPEPVSLGFAPYASNGFAGFSYTFSTSLFGGGFYNGGQINQGTASNGQTNNGQLNGNWFTGRSGSFTTDISGGDISPNFASGALADLSYFFSNLDFKGAATQFGRSLMSDFVKNNKGGFGAWGFFADLADKNFEKPDDSANAVIGDAAAKAAMLITPGGLRAKVVEEVVEARKLLSIAEDAQALASIPGRVQSRINLANGTPKAGWLHMVAGHLSGKVGKSQFSISESELRALLSSREAAASPVLRHLNSAAEIRYVREFDAGRIIGIDRYGSSQGTSIITIQTDRFGNLVTAHPGLQK